MRPAILLTLLLLASCYAPDYANKYVCNPANNRLDCPDGWVCVARRCVLPGSGGSSDQGSSAGSPDQGSRQMCSVAGCDACACPDGGVPIDGMSIPDQAECPSYMDGGGGGKNRPEVLVQGGMGKIQGVTTTVSDFYLDVFDVTVGAYRDCLSAGVCSRPSTVNGDCDWTDVVGSNEDHPLNCETFAQAKAFCTWVGRRLPREDEWAYAAFGARDGAGIYPWGTDPPQEGPDAQLCWGRSNGAACGGKMCDLGECPVGSYPKTLLGAPNCRGLADLAGNSFQWLDTEYENPYTIPEIPCMSQCSMRGGSWYTNDISIFPASYREGYPAGFPVDIDGGFRCARTP